MHYVTKTYGHELGLSCCFRQWRASSHCRFLHGYPLSFKYTLAAESLDKNNWVFDFGGFKEIKAHLVERYDHRLAIASDDPQRHRIEALGQAERVGGCISPDCEQPPVADVLVLPVIGCEGFAELEFNHAKEWLSSRHGLDIVARGLRIVSVEVREHGGNSAIYEGNYYG